VAGAARRGRTSPVAPSSALRLRLRLRLKRKIRLGLRLRLQQGTPAERRR